MEEETAWQLFYTKQAKKDAKKLASSNLKDKAEELLAILAENPFQNLPISICISTLSLHLQLHRRVG
jgi:mRNA-degrading endonuclease RelE of RelBE toxin-antitoxin system